MGDEISTKLSSGRIIVELGCVNQMGKVLVGSGCEPSKGETEFLSSKVSKTQLFKNAVSMINPRPNPFH